MSKKNKNRPYNGTISQPENTIVEETVNETTPEDVIDDTVEVSEEVETSEPVTEESDVEYVDVNELSNVDDSPEEVVNEDVLVKETEDTVTDEDTSEETVEEPVDNELTEDTVLDSPEPSVGELPSKDTSDDSDKFFLMIGNGKELSQAELIDVENKIGENGLQYDYTVTALGIPLIGPYDTAEIAAEKRLEIVRKGIICKVVNKSEVE